MRCDQQQEKDEEMHLDNYYTLYDTKNIIIINITAVDVVVIELR